MKKAIVIVVVIVIAGMIGWTVYDFASSDDEGPDEEVGGATISAPDEDDDEGDSEEKESTNDVGIDIGDKAPDFSLKTMDGKKEKLSDHRGENVIVNFWATWCPPCREEIPALQKLYDNRDVEVLAIDLEETEDNLDDVKEFVYDEFEMEFPVLRDETSKVANVYQVMAYPTSYMVDADGYIRFKAMGAMDYEQMEERLDQME